MPIYVNQVEITDDEVHREMQYHPAASVEEARHYAAQALVIRQLLQQEAKEKRVFANETGTASQDVVDDAIEVLLEQEVSVPEADEVTCARYYEQNMERFVDQNTGNVLPFELVELHIRNYLHTRSMRTGISQYIKVLANKARIAGFDLEASDSPLVQ